MRKLMCTALVAAAMVLTTANVNAESVPDNQYGAVTLKDGVYTMTNGLAQNSVLSFGQELDPSTGIKVSFDYYAGGGTKQNADGFLAQFTSQPANIVDSEGNNIVMSTADDTVAVELDSWGKSSDEYSNDYDPEYKHIAILQGDIENHLVQKKISKIGDSKWHKLTVTYTNSIMRAYIDGTKLVSKSGITLGDSTYFSVTASTGAYYDIQKVKNISVSDSYTYHSIKADKSVIQLNAGKTDTITATVSGDGADEVEYTSSNTSVAKVGKSTGKVVAMGTGTCKITCKSGLSSTTVTVVVNPSKVKRIAKSSTTSTTAGLKWTKVKGVSGYDIWVYDKDLKQWNRAKFVNKQSTYKTTVKKLQKNAVYKFKIRAYVKANGKKYYGAYSSSIKVKTKKK